MTSGHEPAATTIRSWTERARAVALSFFVFAAGTALLADGLGRAKRPAALRAARAGPVRYPP
jgi:hypothetical protein